MTFCVGYIIYWSGSMKNEKKHNPDSMLYKILAEQSSAEVMNLFFEDLCTEKELIAIEQRIDVAILLKKGTAYLDIVEKTGASTATISRVNHFLLNKDNGVADEIILSHINNEDETEGEFSP